MQARRRLEGAFATTYLPACDQTLLFPVWCRLGLLGRRRGACATPAQAPWSSRWLSSTVEREHLALPPARRRARGPVCQPSPAAHTGVRGGSVRRAARAVVPLLPREPSSWWTWGWTTTTPTARPSTRTAAAIRTSISLCATSHTGLSGACVRAWETQDRARLPLELCHRVLHGTGKPILPIYACATSAVQGAHFGAVKAPGQLSVGPARAVLDMHRWTAPPPAHGMHRSGAPRRADPRAARGRRHRRHRRHRRGRSTPVVLCGMAGASKLLPVCGALLPALAGSSRPGPSPALPPPPRPRRLCRRKPRLVVSTMPEQPNIKLCNPHVLARRRTARRCRHTQAIPCQRRQPCA